MPHSNRLILLDKPQGISSNKALQKVKRLLNLRKAGHTGTLDPMATGLLPILTGDYTRFGQFLLDEHKTYHATLKLGHATNTGDAEGDIIAQQAIAATITQATLKTLCQQLTGSQWQTPPIYSALKMDGKPLYEYARKGLSLPRPLPQRQITVHELSAQYQTQHDEHLIHFQAHVSKGTYIRSLGETIATHLGTVGHLVALRRTQIGTLTIDHACTLETLEQEISNQQTFDLGSLLPFAPIALKTDHIQRLKQGQRLSKTWLPESLQRHDLGTQFSVYDHAHHFHGLVQITDKAIQPHKMIPG